jgi:hypothetical protein
MNPFIIYLYAGVLEIAACRALALKVVNRFGGVNFLTRRLRTRLVENRVGSLSVYLNTLLQFAPGI